MRPRWEYFSVSIGAATKPQDARNLLTDYGRGGWELVSVIVIGDNDAEKYFFKRQIAGE